MYAGERTGKVSRGMFDCADRLLPLPRLSHIQLKKNAPPQPAVPHETEHRVQGMLCIHARQLLHIYNYYALVAASAGRVDLEEVPAHIWHLLSVKKLVQLFKDSKMGIKPDKVLGKFCNSVVLHACFWGV